MSTFERTDGRTVFGYIHELTVFGYIHELQTQLNYYPNPNITINTIATLCCNYYGDLMINSESENTDLPYATSTGYYTPQYSPYPEEEPATRPRNRSISLHYGHGTQHSTIIQVDVGDQLNELYDDVLASAVNTLNMPNNQLTKIYEDMGNGKKEYVEDLGDLIEVLDEKENENTLHLYLETVMQKQSSLSSITPTTNMSACYSDSKSHNNAWSIQQTPIPLSSNNSTSFSSSIDCSISSSSSSDSSVNTPNTPQCTMTNNIMYVNPDMIELQKYGYKIVNTIEDTLHGCVYLGEIISNQNAKKITQVAIKKVEKDMYNGNDEDENILKEAVILHYLTKLNKSPSDNICQFIEFIDSEKYYYLISEYCGDITLSKYIKLAHKYITEKKLKIRDWQTVIKYILWQLTVSLYWLHTDMNCCHLDLTLDNIMVTGGEFINNKKDNTIHINTNNLTVKIIDFGYSEIFYTSSELINFQCNKKGLTKDYIHKSPKVYNGEIFNAKKSDMFSLGNIFYVMSIGKYLYEYPNEEDDGYCALKTNKLHEYLKKNNLNLYIRKSAIKIIESLLNINENERINISKVLHCDWFKHYWAQYKTHIQKKSKSQRERHIRQTDKMKHLPYYKL